MARIVFPYRFLLEQIPLSWNDISYGYARQFIGWSVPVNFAVEKLKMGSEEPSEIELAGVTKSETFLISDLVAKLAYAEGPATEESSKRKWLYLHMAWLFENRVDDGSTWDKIDNLFADFGYPESIEHLVSFMPRQPGFRDKTDRRGEAWIAFLEAELQHFQRALRETQR